MRMAGSLQLRGARSLLSTVGDQGPAQAGANSGKSVACPMRLAVVYHHSHHVNGMCKRVPSFAILHAW